MKDPERPSAAQSCHHYAFVTATAIATLTDCGTLTEMESEITERTGKPKDKIKNASKVIRTDIFMEEVQLYTPKH